MASAYAPPSSSSTFPHRAAAGYRAPVAAPTQPSGTFLPGTKVQVGSHRVIIEKYLSEGGFAHVYVVRVPREGSKYELAVLKRVAVPDKGHLASMRTEVETMKKLKGHRKIVLYFDSHASQLKGGGYEVFLLMEYCAGGGLIDFMNTRLQHRLTEPEILKIFGDVAEGVATMHYLKPPLLHRDLKVENVLISKGSGGAPTYKVCDFGSAAHPRPAAKTAEEGRLIEDDVQKHTTMQYRSPEMIDVWRKQPIDEKADIWALGVLLYKLCYYTTPFEEVGQMAILNASFKYPSYPTFSERIKKLIGWTLKEDPKKRPNIYQVVKEVCSMRGAEVPIKDIYANRTQSEARRNEYLPSQEDEAASTKAIGLSKATPSQQAPTIPDIAPMRRGRPTAPAQQTTTAVTKPSAGVSSSDPFAALDSKDYDIRAGAVDDLSKRFPSLDDFAITQDTKGEKFAFRGQSASAASKPAGGKRESLNERVTHALADEVFGGAQVQSQQRPPQTQGTSKAQPPQIKSSSAKSLPKHPNPESRTEAAQNSSSMPIPTPIKAGVSYTSTGTNPSPPLQASKHDRVEAPTPKVGKLADFSKRAPIWRVPSHHRSNSQPRASESAQKAAALLQPSLPPMQRPALLDIHRSKSQTATAQAKSSRPSLEGGRPNPSDFDDGSQAVGRATSVHSRQRPSSVYLNSNLDFLRDAETTRKSIDLKRPSIDVRRVSRHPTGTKEDALDIGDEEDVESVQRKSSAGRRGHKKKPSLSGSISGAKNIFAGRFGDAFKKFESGHGTHKEHDDDMHHYHHNIDPKPLLTPEPRENSDEPRLLSPIAGSETTPSGKSDPDSMLAVDGFEVEEIPPEMRRELERRRLSQEEKRVAAAAEEYRMRVGGGSTGAGSGRGDESASGLNTKAKTIQTRVQSLLDEGRQSPVLKKTAEGYGKYTDEANQLHISPSLETTSAQSQRQQQQQQQQTDTLPPRTSSLASAQSPPTPSETSHAGANAGLTYSKTRPQQQLSQQPGDLPPPAKSAPPAVIARPHIQPEPTQKTTARPSAPPKPKSLRPGSQWPPPREPIQSQDTAGSLRPKGLQALLAKDLEGVPDYPTQNSPSAQASAHDVLDQRSTTFVHEASGAMISGDGEDLEADFSKRYPALSGIEMVEADLGESAGGRVDRSLRVKEV